MNGTTVQSYITPMAAGMQAVWNGTGLAYYRHADWLGSARFESTPTGTVYADRAYAPFGETYAETGAVDRSFTGQTQDVAPGSTGIYDFLFRQQSAAQGRWLVPDPAGLAAVDITNPQTWNRYAYVGNNPLRNVDPLGLFTAGPAAFPDFCGYTEFCFSSSRMLLPLDPLSGGGGGEGGGGGDKVDPSTQPSDPPERPTLQRPTTITCSGSSYVLAGNPANVGHMGFPGVIVTNGSAAVIPRQFTGQFTGGPFMRAIGASTFGTVTGPNGATESFNTLTQAVGNAALGTALQAQDAIMARDPGALVIEIVGGTNTWKGADVNITMPALGEGCPTGTSFVNP